MSPRDLQELQALIGYSFNDLEILRDALTTPAYANEHEITADRSMNRFKTLGDAIIDVIVIQNLIDAEKSTPQELTEEKIEKVRNSALPRLADAIELREYIQWGKGQIKQEHYNSEHLASDCLESLIGAVYFDSGWEMKVTAGVYKRIEKLS